MFSFAKYIIRLDDANEYSDMSKWDRIEKILDKNDIKPLVAVIPKNEDSKLKYSDFNIDFWNIVKRWNDKKCTIGVHGYEHNFHKVDRKKLIFPFYNKSEFAELSLEKQKIKIRKSIEIFKSKGFDPKVWIAPAHCFDELTLKALEQETQIKIISDGISLFPYNFKGFNFIPQQLWGFKIKFFGLWTICLHPDMMNDTDIENFDRNLSKSFFRKKIIKLNKLEFDNSQKTILDKVFSSFFWMKHEIKVYLNRV